MDTAYYNRVEPLGTKNSFLEYEYGKDAAEMTSVIDRKSTENKVYTSVDNEEETDEESENYTDPDE